MCVYMYSIVTEHFHVELFFSIKPITCNKVFYVRIKVNTM